MNFARAMPSIFRLKNLRWPRHIWNKLAIALLAIFVGPIKEPT